jgi:hypothetical protein
VAQVTIAVSALLELAEWCRQRLTEPHGGITCPTPHDAPLPPPRVTTLAPNPCRGTVPLWTRISVDRRQQLRDLLGRLLARLHEARRLEEAGHE